MSKSNILRVVEKERYDIQTFIPLRGSAVSLGPSSLRIRTELIGLTSNNLSYCSAGDLLHWWSAFPVPDSAPQAYHDHKKYGIAPAWGYATVLESTIDGIKPGRTIWGFVPISSHTVDLQLRQIEQVPDDWIETSSHRAKVMNLYQRYTVLPPGFSLDALDPVASWSPVLSVCEAGLSFAYHIFPQSSPPIHPFGLPVSPWTEEHANLDSACIIPIASGTKTARAYLHELAVIAKDGPRPNYTVVEVTSSASGCEGYLQSVPFDHTTVPYSSISKDSFPKRRKYVLLDFGGRDNAVVKVFDAVRQSNPEAEIVTVAIGGEAKVLSGEDRAARGERNSKLDAIQMNFASTRDEAMKRIGESEYFKESDAAFEQIVNEADDGKVLGITLKKCEGLRGESGIEGLWTRLCNGQIPGDEGLLVRLD